MSRSVKIFLCCALVVVTVVAVFAFTGRLNFLAYRKNHIDNQLSLQGMWQEGRFFDIIDLTEERLGEKPLHPNYLLYNGLSHYYIAGTDARRQDYHIESAIRSLRKLLLLDQPPQLGNVYLTLGKAYYHKGQLYYAQAIDYIERALPLGLQSDEAYQYLGAAYAHLGKYDKSVEHLSRAAQDSDSLPLKFALAEVHVISGRVEDAEQVYSELRRDNLNSGEIQQLQLLEVQILIARQQYAQAQEKIERALTEYPNIADAYFYLGEIHSRRNEMDKARYNWRLAIKIDPNHSQALRQLQQ